MKTKQSKTAQQLKRDRIIKNLAKNEERAELFRAELKSLGIVNGSPINTGGKPNEAPQDESV